MGGTGPLYQSLEGQGAGKETLLAYGELLG